VSDVRPELQKPQTCWRALTVGGSRSIDQRFPFSIKLTQSMDAPSKDNGQSTPVRSSGPFGDSHLSIPAASVHRKCFQRYFPDEPEIISSENGVDTSWVVIQAEISNARPSKIDFWATAGSNSIILTRTFFKSFTRTIDCFKNNQTIWEVDCGPTLGQIELHSKDVW